MSLGVVHSTEKSRSAQKHVVSSTRHRHMHAELEGAVTRRQPRPGSNFQAPGIRYSALVMCEWDASVCKVSANMCAHKQKLRSTSAPSRAATTSAAPRSSSDGP